MPRFCYVLLATLSALIIISPAMAQAPSDWKGHWLEPEDKAFAFASSDPTLPGTRFQWTESETQRFSGQVFDSNGKPSANADVWFYGIFGRIPVRERTRTRPDGTFQIEIPAAELLGPIRWVVTAFKGQEFCDPLRDPSTKGVEMHLKTGRSVRLSVFEAKPFDAANNAPIINIQSLDTTRPIENFTVHTEDGRVLRSNDPGTCLVQGLAPRIQYVGISAPGHAFRYSMVDLFEDRDYAFSFSLFNGGTVSGNVHDPDGQPVPWNAIQSATCENATLNLGRTFTSEDGSYTLSGLRIDRKPMVSAFSHGDVNSTYMQQSFLDFQGTRNAISDFRVKPKPFERLPGIDKLTEFGKLAAVAPSQKLLPAVFRGRAVLPDGSPCQDFTLRVQSTTSGRRQAGFAASHGSIGIRFTSDDGHFLFSGLSLGSCCRLILSTPGYRDVYVDPVEPVREEKLLDTDPLLFEFNDAANVRLAVVDSKDRPVPNAIVRLFRSKPYDYLSPTYKDRFLYQGTTDANGILDLPEVTLIEGQWMIESPSFPLQQFPWEGERNATASLQEPISLRLQFQFDPDIREPIKAFLASQAGEILHYQDDLSASNPEWKLEQLLPGTYYLSVGSSNGKSRLGFDAEGQGRLSQVLIADESGVESYKFSFEIVPFDPRP